METKEGDKNKIVLSMPISDTMPGPGNIQFSVDSYEEWQDNYLFEHPNGSETAEYGFDKIDDKNY